MMETLNEIMTVKDVAEYLKLCEMTVYRMAKKNEIPAFKIGGDWRFRKDAIKEWILSKEEAGGRTCTSCGKKITIKSSEILELVKN